jgi:hypothetical protein
MWATAILLGILIIGITAVFTVLIMDLVDSRSDETFNREETADTKIVETIAQDIPTINREDGLSDIEFWTLYNYWNEKDGYGLPKIETEDENEMRFIGSGQKYMGSGVYLGYATMLQHDDEKYAPIWIVGEELEDYSPDVLAAVFKLTIKITEGEDSRFYRNIYQYSKEMIKGGESSGDNHEWKSTISPYEISFYGSPTTESTEQAISQSIEKIEEDIENGSPHLGTSGTNTYSGIENDEGSNLDANSTAPTEEEMEIFVTQGGKKIKEFYTSEEAIAFAETLEDAEVFTPNVPIWDNKPSSVYQGDIYLGEFKTKQEALKFAQSYENAKVINNRTGYVEWDNYPRECGRCESPIQGEYDPNTSY